MSTKIFLATVALPTAAYPWAQSNLARMLRAQADSSHATEVADGPADADAILFVESRSRLQLDVLRSSIYRRWPAKCYVMCFADCPAPMVPGLYTGLTTASRTSPIFEAAPYIRVADNHMLDNVVAATGEEPYLYSFVGKVANCPAIRRAICALSDERALLEDRSSGQRDGDRSYVEVIAQSKFVLCPRGLGPSSWRLYEAMKAGRAPVIIADDWPAPEGIDWDSFSIRVPSAQISQLPAILREREAVAVELGANAKRAWLRCFSYAGLYSWVAERLAVIAEHRQVAACRPPTFIEALLRGAKALGPHEAIRDLRIMSSI